MAGHAISMPQPYVVYAPAEIAFAADREFKPRAVILKEYESEKEPHRAGGRGMGRY